MFNFSYKKNKNDILFKSIETVSKNTITDLQNYIPIYDVFFNVKDKNWNNFNLNQDHQIVEFKKCIDKFKYLVSVKNVATNEITNQSVFIKFSPIIDILFYLTGRYSDYYNVEQPLPSFGGVFPIEKGMVHNNCAYVDMFFYFISNKLKSSNKFIHGLDFFGSYLCKSSNVQYNVYDDMDTLEMSSFFHENNGNLFKLNEEIYDEYFVQYSRHRKKDKLVFKDKLEDEQKLIKELNLSEISSDINELFKCEKSDMNISENVLDVTDDLGNKNDEELILDNENKYNSDDTDEESEDDNTGYDSNSDSEDYEDCSNDDLEYDSECDEGDESDEEMFVVDVNKCPSVMICLENCKETLDSYMENNDIDDEEWTSILMQVIFQLITYQKVFDFTHNDLHTNNIMYQPIDTKWFLYKFNNKVYKVPTYGKIYKLIDFGRSIYKYGKNTLASDCYEPKEGEASSLYNCEPFFNPKKPRIDPNPSFDLCRLGCSLYDFFLYDKKDFEERKVFHLVREWCLDDENRHILYKNENKYDNVERFPGFKLYKMIARKVHRHIPKTVIEHPIFQNYVISNDSDYKGVSNETTHYTDIDVMTPMFI